MKSFRRTLFLSHIVLVLLTTLVLGITLRGLATRFFSEQLRDQLIGKSATVRKRVTRYVDGSHFARYTSDKKRHAIEESLVQFARGNRMRLRIISQKGVSLFDSYRVNGDSPELGTNYYGRQEIRTALVGDTNSIVRGNLRKGSSTMFVAMPLLRWGGVVGCVYVDSPLLTLTPAVVIYARSLLLVTFVVFLVAAFLSAALAQRLALPARRIEETARQLASGDLSARVSMHRRFLGKGDEMDRLMREFNAMARQLEKNDDERRTFLADVSHELRTPLTAIKGSAETLRDGAWKDPAVAPRFAATIAAQSDRLIRLVGDLLKLARLEKRGPFTDMAEEVDAATLLQRSADAVMPLFDERGVKLKVVCEVATVHGNSDLLEQLLINLLANAGRHSTSGSTTTISATNEIGVRLTVADQGSGIAAEHLPNLGQRFYRVEGGRDRESGGSGLGLAICRRIALAHNGVLEIESTEGEGTTVTLILPAN